MAGSLLCLFTDFGRRGNGYHGCLQNQIPNKGSGQACLPPTLTHAPHSRKGTSLQRVQLRILVLTWMLLFNSPYIASCLTEGQINIANLCYVAVFKDRSKEDISRTGRSQCCRDRQFSIHPEHDCAGDRTPLLQEETCVIPYSSRAVDRQGG